MTPGGGWPAHRQACSAVVANDYEGFGLGAPAATG